jgi:invasion protein IalB
MTQTVQNTAQNSHANQGFSVKFGRAVAAATLAASLTLSSAALAATPEPLGTYKDWRAFSMAEGGGNVCFIVSTPQDMSPKNVQRGEVFFLVTDWGNDKPEPSIITGYTFKPNSKTSLQIGSDKFSLFTKDDGAWFRSEKDETRLINAMKRGSKMSVTGTSDRGTLTTDHYSLSGITAALDKISRTCN